MTLAPPIWPSFSPLRSRLCASVNTAMRCNGLVLLLLMLALAAMHPASGASYSNSTGECRTPARVYYFIQSGEGVQVRSEGNGTYKLQIFQASNTTAWFMNEPYRDGGVDPTHAWLQGFAKQTSNADSPLNAALVVNSREGQVTALIEVWDGSLSADGTLQYWARALQGDTQPFSKWPTWDDDLEDVAMDMPTSLFLDGGCDNAKYRCTTGSLTCGCLTEVPMYYQHAACESCGDATPWCNAAFGMPWSTCCNDSCSSAIDWYGGCSGVFTYSCDGTIAGAGDCDDRNC